MRCAAEWARGLLSPTKLDAMGSVSAQTLADEYHNGTVDTA